MVIKSSLPIRAFYSLSIIRPNRRQNICVTHTISLGQYSHFESIDTLNILGMWTLNAHYNNGIVPAHHTNITAHDNLLAFLIKVNIWNNYDMHSNFVRI